MTFTRFYKCKECGTPIGYKDFFKPVSWLPIAVPKYKLCDECYLRRLKKEGKNTAFMEARVAYNHCWDIFGEPEWWNEDDETRDN